MHTCTHSTEMLNVKCILHQSEAFRVVCDTHCDKAVTCKYVWEGVVFQILSILPFSKMTAFPVKYGAYGQQDLTFQEPGRCPSWYLHGGYLQLLHWANRAKHSCILTQVTLQHSNPTWYLCIIAVRFQSGADFTGWLWLKVCHRLP